MSRKPIKFDNPIVIDVKVKYKSVAIARKIELNPVLIEQDEKGNFVYKHEVGRAIANQINKYADLINKEFIDEYIKANKKG
jgi:hypothetical protein